MCCFIQEWYRSNFDQWFEFIAREKKNQYTEISLFLQFMIIVYCFLMNFIASEEVNHYFTHLLVLSLKSKMTKSLKTWGLQVKVDENSSFFITNDHLWECRSVLYHHWSDCWKFWQWFDFIAHNKKILWLKFYCFVFYHQQWTLTSCISLLVMNFKQEKPQ